MINLMRGDCLERMKEIVTGSVDMVLTDPPYEMFLQKSMKRLKSGMLRGDDRKFQEELKNEGLTVGFNVASFLDTCLSLFDKKQKFCGVFTCSTKQVINYITWAESNKLQYGIGVWNKTNPAPLCNCKYLNDVEYWIYIKGNKSKILGNYHSKSMVYTSPINKKDKKEFGHPTCKPVELMEKFIFNHTVEGSAVLDPFMGSGSTGVACKNLNRDFIGIELDETYFNIAKDRIIDPETSDQIKEALGICDENDREREEGEDLVVTVPECVDCETFLVSNAMRINFCPNCESKT